MEENEIGLTCEECDATGVCTECDGDGGEYRSVECLDCNGRGWIVDIDGSRMECPSCCADGLDVVWFPCDGCGGSGECAWCAGTGEL